LLRAQARIRQDGPDPDIMLISEEELHEIRLIWRTERQDWEDSVPQISQEVNGYNLDWPVDDNGIFDADHKALLKGVCAEYEVPFELVAKMLEAERRANGMARRAGIQGELDSVLTGEWRSEEQILAEQLRLC